ncbi:hypothetical protein GUJ93_ZPchr0010g9189 [Zizania palustris]|uniref:Uncharacterized protein n=1 Tax=Zizania palustris TaxID=103762 RepID=A0A8J6BI44_ZIZPA|nr:hypothetical protein GUJ93_ZPchr0010g9189 [Zizania palustris]
MDTDDIRPSLEGLVKEADAAEEKAAAARCWVQVARQLLEEQSKAADREDVVVAARKKASSSSPSPHVFTDSSSERSPLGEHRPRLNFHQLHQLALVRRLLGNSNHPNPSAKLLELDPSKQLGEEVGELVLGVDVASLDAPIVQATPDEVVLDPDVLATLMEDEILRQSQSRLAVYPELH